VAIIKSHKSDLFKLSPINGKVFEEYTILDLFQEQKFDEFDNNIDSIKRNCKNSRCGRLDDNFENPHERLTSNSNKDLDLDDKPSGYKRKIKTQKSSYNKMKIQKVKEIFNNIYLRPKTSHNFRKIREKVLLDDSTEEKNRSFNNPIINKIIESKIENHLNKNEEIVNSSKIDKKNLNNSKYRSKTISHSEGKKHGAKSAQRKLEFIAENTSIQNESSKVDKYNTEIENLCSIRKMCEVPKKRISTSKLI